MAVTEKIALSALTTKSIQQQTLEALQRIEGLMSRLVAQAELNTDSSKVITEWPSKRKHK